MPFILQNWVLLEGMFNALDRGRDGLFNLLLLQLTTQGFAILKILAELSADNPLLIKRIIPLKGRINQNTAARRRGYIF